MAIKVSWFGKKKKGRRRPMSTEQESKKIDLKMKRFAAEALIEKCEDDPELRRAVIAKEFGLKLPERDPLKALEQDFLVKVNEIAMKHLTEDPKSAEVIARRWIREKLGDIDFGEADQKGRQPNDSLSHLLERVKIFEQIKEVMGIPKKGSLQSILSDPQLITAILTTIGSFFLPSSQGSEEPTVTAMIDGLPQTVPKSMYEKLQAEGRVQALIMVESAGSDAEKAAEEPGGEAGDAKDEPASSGDKQQPQTTGDPDSSQSAAA